VRWGGFGGAGRTGRGGEGKEVPVGVGHGGWALRGLNSHPGEGYTRERTTFGGRCQEEVGARIWSRLWSKLYGRFHTISDPLGFLRQGAVIESI
jgi:hypothetical protein